MYKIDDTAQKHLYYVRKACDKCGIEVRFDHKFCGVCGSPLDAPPTEDVNNKVDVRCELEEVGKACIALLAEKYGASLKKDASIYVEGRLGKSHTVSVGSLSLCCEKCGKSIYHSQSFCTECGTRLNVPEEITTELSWSEIEAIVLAKFYEQNPSLRPVQEHEYNIDFSVYQKPYGSADFEDEPLAIFGLAASADDVDANIATEYLLEDFNKDGALYASLKEPLKETLEGILKKWDKRSEFHEDDTFTVYCSLGDLHEFLVDIRITKID